MNTQSGQHRRVLVGFFANPLWVYVGCGLGWLLGLLLTFGYSLSKSERWGKAFLSVIMTLVSTAALACTIAPDIDKTAPESFSFIGLLVLIITAWRQVPIIIPNRDFRQMGWLSVHIGFIVMAATKVMIYVGYLPTCVHVLTDSLVPLTVAVAICWCRLPVTAPPQAT